MTDLLDAALQIAAEGRAVFPCDAEKRPRTPHGFKDATTDPATIEAWDWNGGGTLGAEIPAGQVVIDVDPRNGGSETMDVFLERGLRLPRTRLVLTRSGGSHHYLTVPEGVTLRGSLGPGVDVKRHGKGYVIVPPSEGYELFSARPAMPAPKWLLDELVVPEREGEACEASPPKFFPFERGTAYGLKALEAELERLAAAAEGGRNEALNRAAFAMAQLVKGGELDEGATLGALEGVALDIGLEMAEIQSTLQSGWRAGSEEPRQAPAASSVESAFQRDSENAPTDEKAEDRFWVDWQIDEEPPPFYVAPLLPKNAYVLVYGATEASKSMTWVGLLAEGSHKGVRSSVYSLENPPHTDRDRLRRWAPDPAAFRLTNESIDFNDRVQVEALIAREVDFGTDVLMIDTYSHAFNSRSEDGNAKAIEFARRVRYVMARVGCSVVVVDHTGFEGDEPRDASAKRQQVDVAVLMKKKGHWVKGQAAGFEMRNMKAARFANPFLTFGEVADVPATGGLQLRWTGGDRPSWA